MIGNLATLTRRVVTEVGHADPAAPLVASGGYIYWVRQGGCAADGTFWAPAIEELDLVIGDSTCIGPGEYAFLLADWLRAYISRTDTTLAQLPSGARSWRNSRTLPADWYLPGGFGVAVANGIVVQSEDARWPAHPADLAGWNPRTGRVTVIGRARAIGASTPRGAGHSLLAWMLLAAGSRPAPSRSPTPSRW